MSDDMVNHPPHYVHASFETIDVIEAWVKGYPPDVAFNVGQVLKYLSRGPYKFDTLQDLQKAKWYLDRAVAIISNQRIEVGK